MLQFLAWIIKSKVGKITTGTLGSGGLIGLIFMLHSDIKTEIAHAETASKVYAEKQIENFSEVTNVKLKNLKEGQNEIKTMILRYEERYFRHNHK